MVVSVSSSLIRSAYFAAVALSSEPERRQLGAALAARARICPCNIPYVRINSAARGAREYYRDCIASILRQLFSYPANAPHRTMGLQ